MNNDPYNLNRFALEQNKKKGGVVTAFNEIKNANKKSHWTWFIFPQIDGIVEKKFNKKSSHINKHYSIKNIDEATAYIDNDSLRTNYLTLTRLLIHTLKNKPNITLSSISGPDADKIISSATLFMVASHIKHDMQIFNACETLLNICNNGLLDKITLSILLDQQI
jgi:uncharacterized protein (DUF1810 family)